MEDHEGGWVGKVKKKTSRIREHFLENQFGAVLTSIQTMPQMYFSIPHQKKLFR